MSNQTKVGVGVLVFKQSKILLGKRRGSHGEGEYALPGGHLEHMESFEETALRELAEEVGPDFKVRNLQVVSLINLTDYVPKHYIDIGMACDWVSGEPVVMEPFKVESWGWFEQDNLPAPLFATVQRILYSATADSWDDSTVVSFDKYNRVV
jgi:8-oxo-dGTP diphosphatase